MPKSPCPPGQTRNRVTKSCRDKKKPGRRPGTRKAAAKPKVTEAVFQVDLINNHINDDKLEHAGDHAAKIIKWYKQFKNDFKEDYNLVIKSISHVSADRFKVKYTGNADDLELFLDVDDDGNYPITIRGDTYLVSGELV